MAGKAIEQELLALENEYWQAIKDKNPDPVMRLTDDPCILTGASGVRRLRPKDLAGMMDIPSLPSRHYGEDHSTGAMPHLYHDADRRGGPQREGASRSRDLSGEGTRECGE